MTRDFPRQNYDIVKRHVPYMSIMKGIAVGRTRKSLRAIASGITCRDAHSIDALISQTQYSLSIGENDGTNVINGPVVQDRSKLSPILQ